MAGKNRYTVKQIETALKESGGIIIRAAQVLGCNRETISKRLQKSPRLQRIMEQAAEEAVDIAEATLMTMLRVEYKASQKALTGECEMPRLTASIFALKTKGRHRGYAQSHEVSGPDGGPIQTAGWVIEVPKPLSEEEWERRIAERNATTAPAA